MPLWADLGLAKVSEVMLSYTTNRHNCSPPGVGSPRARRVESALCVRPACVRRNACASSVFREGRTDNKDRYCLVGTLIFCPVMRLKLPDLEVKVAERTEASGGEREGRRRSEFGLRELR